MTVLLAQLTTLATDIDDVNIDFSSGAATVLKIVIATILFGIALDIKITDFTAVLRRPVPDRGRRSWRSSCCCRR